MKTPEPPLLVVEGLDLPEIRWRGQSMFWPPPKC